MQGSNRARGGSNPSRLVGEEDVRSVIELVIFDCDGVLVDTERLAVRIEQTALGELGWELSAEELAERFVGCTDGHFEREVARQIGRPIPSSWRDEVNARYREAFRTELAAVDGVVEALDALEAIPHATCVASNGSHGKMQTTLGITGLHQRFAGRIFSAYDVPHGKPAPDLFLHAALQMGHAPERCVVIEDSTNGVAAARAAGMHVYAYAGGLIPAKRLAGPDTTVFAHMRELPQLIASRSGR